MSKEEYKRYIKSNAWKRLRKAALIRDGYICRFCEDIATDVHHMLYPNDFKNDCLANVVSCCKDCHEEKDKIVGYNKSGVIRITIPYHQCVVCKKHYSEFEMDIQNDKWICGGCESINKGDEYDN